MCILVALEDIAVLIRKYGEILEMLRLWNWRFEKLFFGKC
jgi:hypothetical protein